ncbi:MAG: methyltransferase domain-containing protein [Actinomycetota bacterium]|nr:methyltransferase domain-containing protein [Actinomycetota bacterium]
MTGEYDQIRDQQRHTWDRFSAGWKRWDAFVGGWLAPVETTMIRHAALQGAAEVLDVASGTGEPGLTAAAAVPHGRVTLTDLSERMLTIASDNAAQRGLGNVETRICDAGSLPFADGSFDTVLCRFGFMFVPDEDEAANEFARVARPQARIVAAVWGSPDANPWATTIMGTIARHVALPAASPGSPGLFRCSPDGYMRGVFARAGLHHISEEEVSFELVHDSPEQYWDFMADIAAPAVAGLAKASDVVQQAIHAEVLGLAQQHLRDSRVCMRSTATVVTGIR